MQFNILVLCLLLGWSVGHPTHSEEENTDPQPIPTNNGTDHDVEGQDSTAMSALRRKLRLYYSKALPHDGVVMITSGIYIDYLRVHADDGELELDMYVSETWNDPRLAFESDPPSGVLTRLRYGTSPDSLGIWSPDTVFRNLALGGAEKQADGRIVISGTGDVDYIFRVHGRFRCEDMWRSESISCPITWFSLVHGGDQVSRQWRENEPVMFRPGCMHLAGYDFIDTSVTVTEEYTGAETTSSILTAYINLVAGF